MIKKIMTFILKFLVILIVAMILSINDFTLPDEKNYSGLTEAPNSNIAVDLTATPFYPPKGFFKRTYRLPYHRESLKRLTDKR